MTKRMTLSKYVLIRNGLPIGASGSLSNMLRRSLGAGSFLEFWQHWNPIWGYYLGWYIYAPLKVWFPSAIALITTFVVSGALHDLAISLVRGDSIFLFTPWFFIIGCGIIIGQNLEINYSKYVWIVRASINISFITLCLGIAIKLI